MTGLNKVLQFTQKHGLVIGLSAGLALAALTNLYGASWMEAARDMATVSGVIATAAFTYFLMVHTRGLRESTAQQVKASRISVFLELEGHLLPIVERIFSRHQNVFDAVSARLLNDDALFSAIAEIKVGSPVDPSELSGRHIFSVDIHEIVPDDSMDYRMQYDYKQVLLLSVGFNPGSERVASKTAIHTDYEEGEAPRHGLQNVMILSTGLVDELWDIMTPVMQDIWALRSRALDFEGERLLEERLRMDWRLNLAWDLAMAAWRSPEQHAEFKMDHLDKVLWRQGAYEAYPYKTHIPRLFASLPPNKWHPASNLVSGRHLGN